MTKQINPGLFPVVLLLTLIWISACVHEPILPDNPDPVDTTTVPVDTGSVDTTHVDTTTQNLHPCDPDTVYFERDVLPILISNCAKSGCHDEASAQDGVILSSYARVLASGEVTPGNLGESDLYEVLVDTDPDKRMPPPPNNALDQESINIIAKWISQGAKDLTCSDSAANGCDTTNVTYSGTIAPLLTKYCTGCHSAPGASGGVELNNYSGVSIVANNGKLFGAINHDQGFKQMPQGGTKLPECDILQVKAWIDNGAPNN